VRVALSGCGFGRGRLVCVCVRLGGLRLPAGLVGRADDVAAAFGALEQDVVERGGAQDAAADVSEDDASVAGAEVAGDEVEAGGGGAAVEGVGEMAAVGEEDRDEAEDDGEVGQSSGITVRGRIDWGGLAGRAVWC
jgi:hypothetical protein